MKTLVGGTERMQRVSAPKMLNGKASDGRFPCQVPTVPQSPHDRLSSSARQQSVKGPSAS